jgi:hypothetical protein
MQRKVSGIFWGESVVLSPAADCASGTPVPQSIISRGTLNGTPAHPLRGEYPMNLTVIHEAGPDAKLQVGNNCGIPAGGAGE